MEDKKQIELNKEEIKALEFIFGEYDYEYGSAEEEKKIIRKFFPNFKFYNN